MPNYKGSYFKRRKPAESKITYEDLNTKSLSEIYDFIRCLTDPYPNAYMEDQNGNRLIFKEVHYVSSKLKELD
jgi:methionyl-tRNA formyltransferase